MIELVNPFLLYCPCCGSENIDILYGRDAIVSETYMPKERGSVRCRRCGIGTRMHPAVEQAVKKWNRRYGL